MNWPRSLIILGLCAGATGCATTAGRDGPGPQGLRGFARSRPAAGAARQVSLPPEQDDVFAAAAAARGDKYRLSHYFPGLGKPTPATATATTPAAPATGLPARQVLTAARADAPATPAATPAAATRPSWFAFRKPKAVQVYTTDARPTGGAGSSAAPTLLPIALQVPAGRIADRAVVPTSVDVPMPELPTPKAADEPAAEPAAATSEPAVPGNPDSSAADASPLSRDQPQLAVKPIDPPAARPADQPAPPAAEPSPPAADPAPEPEAEAKPAPEPEPAAVDPRERPRLAAPPAVPARPARDDDKPATRAKPAAEPTRVAAAAPRSGTDAQASRAAPTPADPGHSLGLPEPMLPATYVEHSSVAVRGTSQGQPGPVLASPQVAPSAQARPSAQAAAQPTAATRTWRRPCLRRLVRRMCKLGEFADPPTAAPH